jgi:hypothetical protein
MRCDAMRCDAMRCDAMRCDAMRCDATSVHFGWGQGSKVDKENPVTSQSSKGDKWKQCDTKPAFSHPLTRLCTLATYAHARDSCWVRGTER